MSLTELITWREKALREAETRMSNNVKLQVLLRAVARHPARLNPSAQRAGRCRGIPGNTKITARAERSRIPY